MEKAVIVAALRTPIGRFQGGLSSIPAPKLGAEVIKAVVEKVKLDPETVDEVIMGNVLQAGLGQNPARQAAIHGGLPPTVGAVTINKVCGSGLKSVMLAAQAIKLGDAEVVIAGGFENMSRAPYLLPGARDGHRLGHGKLIDAMINDGLWDHYNDFHMGNTAELVVEKYNVSRDAQDQFALESHRKALAAIERGDFNDEIVPVAVPQRKGDPVVVDADEGPRSDVSIERLARLRPAFKKDGTVTAGNASHDQRRRSRRCGHVTKQGRIARTSRAGRNRRLLDRGYGTRMGDDGSRRRRRKSPGENGRDDGRLRVGRTERSLLITGMRANWRAGRGPGQTQRQRWRRRVGAPNRCVGLSSSRYADSCNAQTRGRQGLDVTLSRRRQRRRHERLATLGITEQGDPLCRT